jgi:hypothetical protein
MSSLKIQGNAAGAGITTLQSANTASSATFTLPATDGTANQVLKTDGSGNLGFATASVGTVTSIDVSGGTTGLSTSGGAITSSGTITLAGTLVVSNGGTGTTTLTGLLKGNGTSAFTVATAGTDYVAPATATTFTANQTFNSTRLILAGATSGTSALNAAAIAGTTTLTLPDQTATLGYIGAPQQSGGASAYTAALSDQGKHIIFTGGSTATLTIPTNASVAFPIGTVILVVNDNSGNLTISGAGVVFQLANGATGNRTVATKGLATCLKTGTDTWYVSGAGVT